MTKLSFIHVHLSEVTQALLNSNSSVCFVVPFSHRKNIPFERKALIACFSL